MVKRDTAHIQLCYALPEKAVVIDLDVEVGRRQPELAVTRLEQHVGEDRNGVAPLDDALHMGERLEES